MQLLVEFVNAADTAVSAARGVQTQVLHSHWRAWCLPLIVD